MYFPRKGIFIFFNTLICVAVYLSRILPSFLSRYLCPGRRAGPLWSKDCPRVTRAGRRVRGRATGWSSCWSGREPWGSGCPHCGCCCCAAGEGRAPAAHRGPPGTAESDRREKGENDSNQRPVFVRKLKMRRSLTLSSSFSPLSLMKTFSSSWLMPSMLLGTLEIDGFGTVMLDSCIWADFDMENCYRTRRESSIRKRVSSSSSCGQLFPRGCF